MSQVFNISNPVIFGLGVSEQLPKLIDEYKATSVLLICSPPINEKPIVTELEALLKQKGIAFSCFDAVTPDPDIQLVSHICEQAKMVKADLLIAIGGGSVIDATKAARILYELKGNIADYETLDPSIEKVGPLITPLIAVPTTSGTGSEVTSFSIVSDLVKKRKMVIAGKNVSASIALVDPTLTFSLPKSMTAATGMDALTHAIEAYISVLASPLSDVNALNAISLISNALPIAVANPNDQQARSDLMLGSVLAGFAFNCAILGLAHAIAHPLGAMFHIPHGVANAVVLPEVVRFNAPSCPQKIKKIGVALGLVDPTINATVDHLAALNKKISIPTLVELGIEVQHFSAIAQEALKEAPIYTNPRQVELKDIVAVLEKSAS